MLKIDLMWCFVCVMVWASVDAMFTPNASTDRNVSEEIIRFYGYSLYMSPYINVAECKPEKQLYIPKNHQSLTVNIFSELNFKPAWCKVDGSTKTCDHKFTGNISESLQKSEYYCEGSVVNVTEVTCLLLGKLYTLMCTAAINVLEGDIRDNSTFQYSGSNFFSQLITDVKESYLVANLNFSKNSKLEVECRRSNLDSEIDDFTLIRRDINGTERELVVSQNYYSAETEVQLNSSFSGDEIVCVQRNMTINKNWETAIRLHYREESIHTVIISRSPLTTILLIIILPMSFMIAVTSGYYYWRKGVLKRETQKQKNNKHRDTHMYEEIPCVALGEKTDKHVKSGTVATEPRSSTPDSDDYAEIYDVVYEDRRRIEKVLQDKKADTKRPKPPPIETMPLRVLPPSPSRVLVPPYKDSLIPQSDLYLLHIDSGGYEIPDELKFISPPDDRYTMDRVPKAKEIISKMPISPLKESTPLHVLPSAPSRALVPTNPDSLIPQSDLYLLNIDSEGYEIPDELKFIPPVGANETT